MSMLAVSGIDMAAWDALARAAFGDYDIGPGGYVLAREGVTGTAFQR